MVPVALALAMRDLPSVCEEINLPVQAGDDTVLRRMARGYSVAHYREMIAMLRSIVPRVAVTTDVIVGFCGETAEQFEHSRDLVVDLKFDQVHVITSRASAASATLPAIGPTTFRRMKSCGDCTRSNACKRPLRGRSTPHLWDRLRMCCWSRWNAASLKVAHPRGAAGHARTSWCSVRTIPGYTRAIPCRCRSRQRPRGRFAAPYSLSRCPPRRR